jgi:hypothetical protein
VVRQERILSRATSGQLSYQAPIPSWLKRRLTLGPVAATSLVTQPVAQPEKPSPDPWYREKPLCLGDQQPKRRFASF